VARNQPLDLYQGDDWAATVYVHDGNGDPIPALDTYTVAAEIRRSSADTDATVDATIITAVDVGLSAVNLSLPGTTTAGLSGTYRWDLQVKDPSGVKTTILYGQVTVLAEVTRIT
jgi:hypothetical protein